MNRTSSAFESFARAEKRLNDAQFALNMSRRRAVEHLRAMRIKSGVSVRALAMELGISAAYLSDIERSNRGTSSEWCFRVARIIERLAS